MPRLLKQFKIKSSQFDRWIKDEYNNPPVIVTETGWSDEGELNDKGRIEYLHDHLEQVLDVVLNDECDLKAYTSTSDFVFNKKKS